MRNAGKFLIGGIIGAVIGFLIAPKHGERVREALLRRVSTIESVLDRETRMDEPSALVSEPPVSVAPPAPMEEAFPPVQMAEPVDTAEASAEILTEIPSEPATEPITELDVEAIIEVDLEPESIGEMEAPRAKEVETAETSAPDVDLRVRIEETRRRIQAELESPFQLGDAAVVTEEMSSPVLEVQLVSETPVADDTPGSEVAYDPGLPEMADDAGWVEAPEETKAVEATDFAGPAEDVPSVISPLETLSQPSTELDPAPESGEPQSFDYEEMRRRIEQTRSRLKSKAFDAMMTGETALLARDQREAPAMSDTGDSAPLLDADVDETIESSLSETDI
ncbi:MAG: hypothetical protein GX604_05580 [Actinobacteria bacterium]|nr:hypothetical protein [Actinomycetota bacterium]